MLFRSLGSRWLAYPSNELLPKSAEPEPTTLENVAATAQTAARELATGLFDLGKKAYASYWSSSNTAQTPPKPATAVNKDELEGQADDARAGAVKLFDVVRLRTLCHFRAHWNALAALAFDNSGTLLVTAALDGQTFNVYSLRVTHVGPTGVEQVAPRQLYRLVRGFTSAIIQSVSFSGDARWLAVSSMRGTTHLYAISARGGPVSVRTHARGSAPSISTASDNTPELDYLGSMTNNNTSDLGQSGGSDVVLTHPGAAQPEMHTLHALTRIKTFASVADEHSGAVLRVPAIASTSLFADAAPSLGRTAPGPPMPHVSSSVIKKIGRASCRERV